MLNSDIRVDGKIIGNIVTGGMVIIGKAGELKGGVVAGDLHVYGVFQGDARVSGTCHVYGTGSFLGKMTANKLHAVKGCILSGTISINDGSSTGEKFQGISGENGADSIMSPTPVFHREVSDGVSFTLNNLVNDEGL